MARKTRKRKPARTPRPTPKVRTEIHGSYLAGNGSLRDLAEKAGVHFKTVQRWAAEDGWLEERGRIAGEARAAAAEAATESLAEMLLTHRRAAARIASLALDEIEKRALDQGGLSSSSLEQLSRVFARMVPVQRLAAGIDRSKPVNVLPDGDGPEVVCEIDAPDEDGEGEQKPAPGKASA